MRRRPEARLEVDILLDIGKDPSVALYRNPVGQGYYRVAGKFIARALRPWPAAWCEVEPILHRNKVTYGLAVGSPDLVGIGIGSCPSCSAPVPGHFVGGEVKDPDGGRLRAEQKTWREAARARGARVEVWRSVEAAREAMGLS